MYYYTFSMPGICEEIRDTERKLFKIHSDYATKEHKLKIQKAHIKFRNRP